MGEVVQLPRRRVVRKPRSGVKIDASRVLREHEQTKKFVADLDALYENDVHGTTKAIGAMIKLCGLGTK